MKRLFGTDGVRGVAGQFPLDDETVVRIGAALARTLMKNGAPPRVVIGRDTRASGPAIQEALTRGIESHGGSVDRGGVLTTPAVACVTKALGYDAGVVISASHNPYKDNGIKVFSSEGFKLPDALEMEIERQVLDGPGSALASAAAAKAGGGRHVDAR
jgi:phosphoglucosamine mutase